MIWWWFTSVQVLAGLTVTWWHWRARHAPELEEPQHALRRAAHQVRDRRRLNRKGDRSAATQKA